MNPRPFTPEQMNQLLTTCGDFALDLALLDDDETVAVLAAGAFSCRTPVASLMICLDALNVVCQSGAWDHTHLEGLEVLRSVFEGAAAAITAADPPTP